MNKHSCITYISAVLSAALLSCHLLLIPADAASAPKLKIETTKISSETMPEDRIIEVDISISGNQDGFRMISFGLNYSEAIVYQDFKSGSIAGDAVNVVCNPEEHLLWCMGVSSSAASVASPAQETLLKLYFQIPEEVTGGSFSLSFLWTGMDGSSAYWYTDKTTNLIDEVMNSASAGSVNFHDGSTLEPEFLRMNQGTQSQLTVLNAAEEVFWLSSANEIASVDSTGLVTAKSAGECDIQAFIDNQMHTCHVVVNQDDCYTLEDKGELNLKNPERTVILEYPDNPAGVRWQTDNPNAVAIDENGKLTFPHENCSANIFGTANGVSLRMKVNITYDETQASSENLPEILSGDVDLNGKIDIMDVIALNKAILGKLHLTDIQQLAADFDGDKKISARDSLNIMKRIVGLL